MKLNASNLATELGRFITLAILIKKGSLTRNELLVFWSDFFREWEKIQIQSGYFYPMLRNLTDKGVLVTSGEGRAMTYSIAPDRQDEIRNYLSQSKKVLGRIAQYLDEVSP